MKIQLLLIAFIIVIGCNTSVEQVPSLEDQINSLAQDPRYLEYTLNSLIQAQAFDKKNPDWEKMKSNLINSGITNLCSEEITSEISSIEGATEFRTFFCKQQELFRSLKSDYPLAMSNHTNMGLAHKKLKTSPKFASEFERITGLSPNHE